MATKKAKPAKPALKRGRALSAEEAQKKLQALRAQDSTTPGAFGEAARLTLAMMRLGGGPTTKAQRAAEVNRSIDEGLRADLARYPGVVLKRLPKLLREEIAKREVEMGKAAGASKSDETEKQRADWLRAALTRNGLTTADANELVAGFLGNDAARRAKR